MNIEDLPALVERLENAVTEFKQVRPVISDMDEWLTPEEATAITKLSWDGWFLKHGDELGLLKRINKKTILVSHKKLKRWMDNR